MKEAAILRTENDPGIFSKKPDFRWHICFMRQPKQRTIALFTQIKGLVTREIRYKENDKILTIITADRGCLNVRAKGAMRMRSPLASACQLYAYADFTLFEFPVG